MSKLYEKYLKLKGDSKKYLYLFECGNFYIFIDEDAKKINSIFGLKLTSFTKDVLKCGFPKSAYGKYLQAFKEKKIKFKLIDSDVKRVDSNTFELVDYIKNIELESITPLESFEILKDLKNKIMN